MGGHGQDGSGRGIVDLRSVLTERGAELLDLPRAPLPRSGNPGAGPVPAYLGRDPAGPCPTDPDTLPEVYRSLVFNTKTPHSIPTFLVDGQVGGKWKVERTGSKATLIYVPFERLPGHSERNQRDVRDEAGGPGAVHGA